MKQKWLKRYRDAAERDRKSVDILTGFNANIDVIYNAENVDLNSTKPQHVDSVEKVEELKQELKYCIENGLNEEVELETDIDLGQAKENVGGQAGIMSNFLSNQNHAVIFYTPFLSEELAQKMNKNILSPVMDGKFVLKNVRDTVTADRTKRNIIVEYENESTGRTIFSRKMKGFGPYFRKGIEDNFDQLKDNIDRAILSGFHDVEGNMEAKLKKAQKQLEKLNVPLHLEYVYRKETAELILDHVMPEVDSIGLDEDETEKIAELIDIDVSDNLSLGDAFKVARELIKLNDMERVHIHTYRYHVTVTDNRYNIAPDKIRDSMLYGELSAIISAEEGRIPAPEDYSKFDMENKHIHILDDLEHFEDFFNIEGFVETGIAELHGLNIVAIPTIIHEDPKKVVGLGDIISSGAYIDEIS